MPPRSAAPARCRRGMCSRRPFAGLLSPGRPRESARPPAVSSPLLPISVMAACLALILGATLWFTPHRNPVRAACRHGARQRSGHQAETAIARRQRQRTQNEPEAGQSPCAGKCTGARRQRQQSALLRPGRQHERQRRGKRVRCTSPTARPSRRCRRFWCARSRRSRPTPQPDTAVRAGGDQRRRRGHASDRLAATARTSSLSSSTDAQYYRVPGAAAEFCRLTGLPENRA